MSETEYCYSTDQERFIGGEWNRQQAAERASEEVTGRMPDGESKSVWTGECDPVDSLWLAGGLDDCVLEFMDNAVYELIGDAGDSYTDHVSVEAQQALKLKLDALMVQWAREYDVSPKLWTVECIEEHTVRRGEGEHGGTIYLDDEPLV